MADELPLEGVSRLLRTLPIDSVVHVVNRGNERRRLFDCSTDYEQFLGYIDRTLQRRPMRILGYALMPNHWHFVLWPVQGAQLSQFLHYLTTLHAARFRYASGTAGLGHVYQGRFHSTIVEDETQYVRTVRYVEANPLRAQLVQRAQDWPWTSLAERLGDMQRVVEGPVGLPPPAQWAGFVNEAIDTRSAAR